MVFSSNEFLLLFFPILFMVYYIPIKKEPLKRRWRNAILLLFSLGFYAWGEPVFVFVMLLSIFANWFLTLKMVRIEDKKNRKGLLSFIIAFDVAVLFVFKYISFLSKNLSLLLHNDALVVDIALPIGISFFTFQMMSYVFDVYYGKTEVQKNPFYVALYISLFPQLIAGPIVRYRDIENEILNREESLYDIECGIRRFIYGLGKKVLIANYMAQIADNVFDFVDDPSVLTAWLGIIAYTLQIYFDFSGYSDMAIGLGRIFGFHFLENFNYPYISKSITEFWRRWHISLSSWFRDYVYIPLGGNRVKKVRWVWNIFVVWALTGIWHGANWTFLVWGLLYFAFLLIEKLTGFAEKIGWASHIYTMLVIMIAWVFFRSENIATSIEYIGHMFGIGTTSFIDSQFISYIGGTYSVLLVAIIGCTPLVGNFFKKLVKRNIMWVETIWLIIIFGLSIINVISSTYNPFIYFNF